MLKVKKQGEDKVSNREIELRKYYARLKPVSYLRIERLQYF